MIRIGLIGENENDTTAIKHLLQQKYKGGDYTFITLGKRITGDKLYVSSSIKVYNIEIRDRRPKYVIVIKDADAIIIEREKIREKCNDYDGFAKELDCKSIFLLNIFELEALILADIERFNEEYGTRISYTKNVALQKEPKELLKRKTFKGQKQYSESHCKTLFQTLRFDVVRRNCSYFDSFIVEFDKRLGS